MLSNLAHKKRTNRTPSNVRAETFMNQGPMGGGTRGGVPPPSQVRRGGGVPKVGTNIIDTNLCQRSCFYYHCHRL